MAKVSVEHSLLLSSAMIISFSRERERDDKAWFVSRAREWSEKYRALSLFACARWMMIFLGFRLKCRGALKISHPFEKRRVKDGCERRALDDSSSKC